MSQSLRILIAAGGTGGHVFPALATADTLRKEGHEVIFIGTVAGLEAKLVPAANFTLRLVDMAGLRGKGMGRVLAAPYLLGRAVLQARALMRELRPDVLLGMGGFVSGPAGLAARFSGIPLVIHEQNAIPGYANRLLARFAQRVLTGFPVPSLGEKARWVGNPVRDSITALPAPASRLSDRSGAVRLLVMGGSLGARDVNRVFIESMARLPADKRPAIRHQTGEKHFAEVDASYREAGIAAQVMPFIQDVAEALAWADLAICRAGALTIAELAGAGLGAILVPYPYAVDDHQAANARFLVQAGAAVLIRQAALTPDSLLEQLEPLLRNPQARLEKAEKARALAKPEAAASVAAACVELALQRKEMRRHA